MSIFSRNPSVDYTINATDNTKSGTDSSTRNFEKLDDSVRKFGVGIGVVATGAIAGLTAMSAAAAVNIDAIGKLATQTGASVEFIQAYRREAELSGIATGTFDTAIEKMSRRVSDAATGFGTAVSALEELNLSADKLAKLSPEEQYKAISDALGELATQGDKARLASDIFGISGASVIRASADAILGAKDEMVALNIALTSTDVRAVEAMNDALFLARDNISIATNLFTSQMAPAITGITNQIFGATDSLGGLRDTSIGVADVFVDVIGAIGNGVEGLKNVFDGIAIGLQEVNVLASRAGALFGSEESTRLLEEQLGVLQRMKDELAGQVGDATFWVQLEQQVEAARAQAAAAGEEFEATRAQIIANSGSSAAPLSLLGGDSASSVREPSDSAFNSLLDSLADGTEKIARAYENRLAIIDDFRADFPGRYDEALTAEIASLEAYNAAIAEYQEKQDAEAEKEKETTLRPLNDNFDAVRSQFQAENEVIVEEYENRKALLEELAEIDLERRAEINDLLVELAQDKEDRIAAIERSAVSKRVQIQSNYAAQALSVAASLVDSLGGQGERSKRIAARISQAEALIAGISAAERARNHAALTGGVISGGAAAALSWASTIANVAGIEAALNGSAPGGVSTSSGVSSGDSSSNQSALESGGNQFAPIEMTFVFDDELIDRDALSRMTVNQVATATQNRDLVYNQSRSYYESNNEGAG